MNSIQIKRARTDELDQLQAIAGQTFVETFAAHNTVEDMQHYLNTNLSISKLAAELNNPDSQFYFAIRGSDVIGYLKINLNEAQTELKDKNSMEIERIYVLASHQGLGVGQLLYDAAFTIAQEKGLNTIWLGVWERNTKAIEFYRKNNFVEFDKHIFKLGNDEQTDILMRRLVN